MSWIGPTDLYQFAELPAYRQLCEVIIERIRRGALVAGDRLPPTRRLAQSVGAHRNTVVRAYEELASEGWVSSEVGRGTYVAQRGGAAEVREPEPSPAIPWGALMSTAAQAEPLTRVNRLGRRRGRDAINLTGNQPGPELLPDDLLRPCVEHVLRTRGSRGLVYGPRLGVLSLREAVCQDLSRRGVPARPESVLITTGSQQALDLVVRALINPGDRVLVEGHTYSGALNLMAMAGAQITPVDCDDDGPLPSALERVGTHNVKCLYTMPNCQNPTGVTMSVARRHALVDWSAHVGVPLIEDDYGADLNFVGGPEPVALRALDGQVIHLGTYSKKLIPALRVGYLIAPEPLLTSLVTMKHAMDLGTSVFLQHVLAEFLDRGYLGVHLERTLPVYRERRAALLDAMAEHLPSSVSWRAPERGLVVWIELPPASDAVEAFREAEKHGVLVAPGTLMSPGHPTRSGLRLAFGTEPTARLVEGVRRLGQALAAWDQQRQQRNGSSVGPDLSSI